MNELDNLQRDIKSCQQCKLCYTLPKDRTPVPGTGPIDAKIMFVGECPGQEELGKTEPFVGPAGSIFNRALQEVGLNRKEVYICNLINCWSRQGNKNVPSPDFAINACKGWLWKQMQLVKPKVVVPMGGITIFTLLGMKKQALKQFIGKEFTVPWAEFTIIPSYHPSYVQMGGSTKAYNSIVSVFKMVKEKVDNENI